MILTLSEFRSTYSIYKTVEKATFFEIYGRLEISDGSCRALIVCVPKDKTIDEIYQLAYVAYVKSYHAATKQ